MQTLLILVYCMIGKVLTKLLRKGNVGKAAPGHVQEMECVLSRSTGQSAP